MRWVVMGVSGVGKSSVAAALAAATGGTYIDADDLHPVCNVEKMASGKPLDDSDRWAWLDAVGKVGRATKPPVFIACSALSQSHRARLHGMEFLYLRASEDVIAKRLGKRKGHFMGVEMLNSQFKALEAPTSNEAYILDTECSLNEVIEKALKVIERK